MTIQPYAPADSPAIRDLLTRIGWATQFIDGQIDGLAVFNRNTENSCIFVASVEGMLIGYVSMQFTPWHRLAQLHGLAVNPDWRRHGVARLLVRAAEAFARERDGRGVYVDTPVNNVTGRAFYESMGYEHDYTMSKYYDEGIDGVTYVKFFGRTALP